MPKVELKTSQLSETKESLPPLDLWIITVDWGSTALKVEQYGLMKDGTLFKSNDGEWIAWTQAVTIEHTGPSAPYKIVKHEDLEHILDLIEAKINEVAENAQDERAKKIYIAETGFTNDLVVSKTLSDGTLYHVLLGDDPSLFTKFTKEQEIILSNAGLSIDPRDHQSSSLLKLLALKNNPDLVEWIMGEGTTFDELQFTTATSIVTDRLQKLSYVNGIQPGDWGAFGKKYLGHPEMLRKLLDELGILDPQLHLNTDTFVMTFAHMVGYNINDWVGEQELIGQMINTRETVVLCMDTIMKYMCYGNFFDHAKNSPVLIDHFYQTLRHGGSVQTDIMQYLYSKEDGSPDYEKVHEVVKKHLDQPLSFDYFYDPEGDNEHGGAMYAIDYETGQMNRIYQYDFHTYSDEEKEKILMAAASGVLFNIRERLERAIEEHKNITIYGGLGSHNQEGWNILFAQIFSDATVTRVDGIDGATAAAWGIASRLMRQEHINEITIDLHDHVVLSENRSRISEYYQWYTLREYAEQGILPEGIIYQQGQ